jgi:ABC-type sugar transport system ATPase subunit
MADNNDVVPAIEATGLIKRFGATTALAGVDFRLERGEILAVFGENGAGKSTLVRILSGDISPDEGEIKVAGDVVKFNGPRAALDHGITLVPQELAGCNNLSVGENMLTGHLPARRGLVSKRGILDVARRLCAEFEVDLPVEPRLDTLPLADRQLVEILKGLGRNAKVLLLDEPTATLTDAEAERVLGHVRRLAGRGVSSVLITHRISEALAIADRVVVLRNGHLVHHGPTSEIDQSTVVRHMLGAEAAAGLLSPRERSADASTPIIEMSDWNVEGANPLTDFTLTVNANEIVVLYGLRGSGVESVASGLAGDLPGLKGEMRLSGATTATNPFRTPTKRRSAGVAYVPSDRRAAGVVRPLSIRDNLLFASRPAWSHRGGFRRRSVEAVRCQQMVKDFDIRCTGIEQTVGQLSGGNQQKVLIASRLLDADRAIVLHEPTRGVDIGARESIHHQIRALRSSDIGVLVLTSDIDEVLALADRVVVLRRGRLAGELAGSSVQKDAILIRASGDEGDEANDAF